MHRAFATGIVLTGAYRTLVRDVELYYIPDIRLSSRRYREFAGGFDNGEKSREDHG
jgi:hypothetical protein